MKHLKQTLFDICIFAIIGSGMAISVLIFMAPIYFFEGKSNYVMVPSYLIADILCVVVIGFASEFANRLEKRFQLEFGGGQLT